MTGAGQDAYSMPQISDQSAHRTSYLTNSSYLEPKSLLGFSDDNQIPKIFNTVESGGSSNPVTTERTGIKLRSRQNLNQASAINSAAQGSAPRRIRLQKKMQVGPVQCRLQSEDVQATNVNTLDESKNKDSNETNIEDGESHDSSTNVLGQPDIPGNRSEDIISVSSKCAAASSVSWSVYMPIVIVAVSLIIVLVGVWGYFRF